VPASELGDPYYGDHTYAWVLSAAKRLKTPVAYKHPQGAVIWVTLDDGVLQKVRA
jgi:hypothetical protein